MCLRAVNSSPGRTPTCISLLTTTILTELQNFSKWVYEYEECSLFAKWFANMEWERSFDECCDVTACKISRALFWKWCGPQKYQDSKLPYVFWISCHSRLLIINNSNSMVDCLMLSHRPFLFRDIKINSQTFIALRIWSLIKQHPLVYLFLFLSYFPFTWKCIDLVTRDSFPVTPGVTHVNPFPMYCKKWQWGWNS